MGTGARKDGRLRVNGKQEKSWRKRGRRTKRGMKRMPPRWRRVFSGSGRSRLPGRIQSYCQELVSEFSDDIW